MPFTSRISQAKAVYEQEIQRIGDELRETVIAPICRRRGLHFYSEHNTYVFHDVARNRTYSPTHGCPDWLRGAFELLNTPVGTNFLCAYVKGYEHDLQDTGT